MAKRKKAYSADELKRVLEDEAGIDGFLEKIGYESGKLGELSYDPGARIVERFLGALFTDQLIILCGPPGTGKTSLPYAVAEALGAECRLIPVQPNWTDNQDLMGYYNPIDHEYFRTPFLDVLLEADQNPEQVYFVVLDEMNLAHIEYYFSTMLSVMEAPEQVIPLYSDRNISSGEDKKGNEQVPPSLAIPKNVQIIGTLNMDETTKGISPKVVDRSYILEIGGNSEPIQTATAPLPLTEFEGQKKSIENAFRKSLSYRALKQIGRMALRRFLTIDDMLAGEVLPMLRDHIYHPDLLKENGITAKSYPITMEKLGRMELAEVHGLKEGERKADYWKG